MAYFETSALDGSNIEHAFDVIVGEMVKKFGDEINQAKRDSNNNNKAINIDVGNKKEKAKKGLFGCC